MQLELKCKRGKLTVNGLSQQIMSWSASRKIFKQKIKVDNWNWIKSVKALESSINIKVFSNKSAARPSQSFRIAPSFRVWSNVENCISLRVESGWKTWFSWTKSWRKEIKIEPVKSISKLKSVETITKNESIAPRLTTKTNWIDFLLTMKIWWIKAFRNKTTHQIDERNCNKTKFFIWKK